MKSCDGASKLERKMVEKNRRMHMKNLILKLSSFVPKDHNFSKDTLTQQDYLDHTAAYINHMKERIENLKRRKAAGTGTGEQMNNEEKVCGLNSAMVEITHRDSRLEVVLISGQNKRGVFHEVIGALEEEGVEVINASFSFAAGRIFHTIHCQELGSTIGLDTSDVYKRLKELIAGVSTGSE